MKNKTFTPDPKPELGTFKLGRGSLMPDMGPLTPRIGRLRPVYGPLRFKTPEWAVSQTWDVGEPTNTVSTVKHGGGNIICYGDASPHNR